MNLIGEMRHKTIMDLKSSPIGVYDAWGPLEVVNGQLQATSRDGIACTLIPEPIGELFKSMNRVSAAMVSSDVKLSPGRRTWSTVSPGSDGNMLERAVRLIPGTPSVDSCQLRDRAF